MAHINFVVPQSKNELLSDNDNQYYVKNVIGVKEIQSKLNEARLYLNEEGPEFILDNFDIFYSVLYHTDTLQTDIIMKAHGYLHKAAKDLNNVLGFLLEDAENLSYEQKMKTINVLKMLLYVYVNSINTIEQKIEVKRSQILHKGRPRKKFSEEDGEHGFDKKNILLTLHYIIQREINHFWDPPVVEESFVNMIGEVCYRFLENPAFKFDKELRLELFSMLGTLIKSYNHGMTFVVRIVQLIKMHEHLVGCISEGIQILVQNYNCKSLVRDFIREITEWQTDEKYQDAQGARNCANVLIEMANIMPDLMIPEVMYLNSYLAHDSYTLRNSILHVITEVILKILTKTNLSEEQKESRDEFLIILEDHIYDTSALVRAKVFQHWAKLQQENAIPLKIQAQILEKAVAHLRDKAANARKCAANCVTIFLSYNIYGAQLQLDMLEKDLQKRQQKLDALKECLNVDHLNKIKEVEELWTSKEEKMRSVIEKKINDGNIDVPSESQIAKRDLPELMRIYLEENKYEQVFDICRTAAAEMPQWLEARQNLNEDEQVKIFLMLIRSIFTDLDSDIDQFQNVTEENKLQELDQLANSVEYLTNAVNFLRLINSAIKPMKNLLESASIGDMQEAIEFFISAYQFNINNALSGVLEMLKIMQRNEKERKDYIIDAFKKIYLTTDSTNIRDHTTTIVNRLINLLQSIPFENIQDLQLIISEWASSGVLDMSIIDMLWQYYTKKNDVSNEESRAALYLLKMVATGRRTVASKNIKLISTIGFGDRGKTDIILVAGTCQLLQVSGQEKQNVTDKNPPFKIKADDPMWTDLVNILVTHFYKNDQFYNHLMSEAIETIYRICSKPERVCESIVVTIINSVKHKDKLKGYVIAQCAHMLGVIALKQLNFLDEIIYKELKRRNYIREEHRPRKSKNTRKETVSVSASKRSSKNSTTNTSIQTTFNESGVGDSELEGAEAEDADAEFIMDVLENHTVTKNGLASLAYIIIGICERPDIYDDLHIQGTAVNALLRYMTVSSKYCEKNIQLIFTILERTKYSEIKSNILIHCSDLLERFPNIVEPWTPRLYERLKDNCIQVRISTFFMLANLILRDMIRVQGHISEMAHCIVAEVECLKEMSMHFFTQFSRKANNLYNILPDMFSHLSEQPDLKEEDLKFIMKFLFELIDKNKQMENLVDRFCSKFRLTDDDYKCRNIAYCLSLIQYNEKGLRRLSESFPYYKNFLVNDDVYLYFKQILSTCAKSVKNELKEIAAEIEGKINSMFDTEDGQNEQPKTPHSRKTPSKAKSAFKKPRGKAPRKKQTAKKGKFSDSENKEEEEERKENATPPTRASSRVKRRPRGVVFNDSDSD